MNGSRIPGETHSVRRLFPDSAEITVAEQLAGLDLGSAAHAERPYLILNFATTLDGRAAIEGKSGPIGSATDSDGIASPPLPLGEFWGNVAPQKPLRATCRPSKTASSISEE